VHVRDWARGLPGITSQAISANVDCTVNTVFAAEVSVDMGFPASNQAGVQFQLRPT
jgi:hypothetical protein